MAQEKLQNGKNIKRNKGLNSYNIFEEDKRSLFSSMNYLLIILKLGNKIPNIDKDSNKNLNIYIELILNGLNNIHYSSTNEKELRDSLKAVKESISIIYKKSEKFKLEKELFDKIGEMEDKINEILKETNKIIETKDKIGNCINYIKNIKEENGNFELDKISGITRLYSDIKNKNIEIYIDIDMNNLNYYFLNYVVSGYALKKVNNDKSKKWKEFLLTLNLDTNFNLFKIKGLKYNNRNFMDLISIILGFTDKKLTREEIDNFEKIIKDFERNKLLSKGEKIMINEYIQNIIYLYELEKKQRNKININKLEDK